MNANEKNNSLKSYQLNLFRQFLWVVDGREFFYLNRRKFKGLNVIELSEIP